MPPFKPPKSGNLPKGGKTILSKTYIGLRKRGIEKERSAKLAWYQVKKKYKRIKGKWVKKK
jgi:hypothetical protein